MRTELSITSDRIDEAALISSRKMSPSMGAAVSFAGVVRGSEGPEAILAIDYEAFQTMAERQFALIFRRLEQNWPVESVRLFHRIGRVEVNEASLWVEVIAPHRAEAFAACQFLIDEMKRVVPIWKKPLMTPNTTAP